MASRADGEFGYAVSVHVVEASQRAAVEVGIARAVGCAVRPVEQPNLLRRAVCIEQHDGNSAAVVSAANVLIRQAQGDVRDAVSVEVTETDHGIGIVVDRGRPARLAAAVGAQPDQQNGSFTPCDKVRDAVAVEIPNPVNAGTEAR